MNAELPLEESNSRLRDYSQITLRITEYALCCAGILTPAAVGAVIGFVQPHHIELAPGVSIEANLSPANTTDVSLGTPGGGTFPKFRKHLPAVGNIASYIQVDAPSVTNIEASRNVGLYVALFEDPEKTIARPIVERALSNSRQDALKGLAGELVVLEAAVVGDALYRKLRRAEKTKEDAEREAAVVEHEADLAAVPGALEATVDSRQKLRQVGNESVVKRPARWRRPVAALLGLAVAAGGGLIAEHSVRQAAKRPPAATITAALNPDLVKLDPHLVGAKLYSPAAIDIVNGTSTLILNKLDTLNNQAETIDSQLETLVDKRQQAGLLPYVNNKNYDIAEWNSDEHCDQLYWRYFFPTATHAMDVKFDMNTGDVVAASNALPLQSTCVDVMTQALRPTPQYPKRIEMAVSFGNHDGTETDDQMRHTVIKDTEGNSYDPYKLPDGPDGSVVTIAHKKIVVSSDPRQSPFGGGISPTGIAGQQALARQGMAVAKLACKVTDETGRAPIVMTHEAAAGFATLERGCTSIAESGHTHVESPAFAYRALNGRLELKKTQGTSPGVPEDAFSAYTLPARPATTSFLVFPRGKDTTPIGEYNLTLTPTLQLQLSHFQPFPTTPNIPTNSFNSWLEKYDLGDFFVGLLQGWEHSLIQQSAQGSFAKSR